MYFVQLRNHNHKRTWGWEWDEKGCQFLLRMSDVVSGPLNSEPFLFVIFKRSQKCSVSNVKCKRLNLCYVVRFYYGIVKFIECRWIKDFSIVKNCIENEEKKKLYSVVCFCMHVI